MTELSITYFFIVFCSIVAFNYLKPQLRPYLLLLISLTLITITNWIGTVFVFTNTIIVFKGAQIIERSSKNNSLYVLLICFNIASIIFFNTARDYYFKSDSFLIQLFTMVGSSYFILQHIAYIIDVKHKTINAETNFLMYFLSVVYFPKLVNGPVARYQELKPQMIRLHGTRGQLYSGVNRISWGLFKLLVIGLPIGLSVDSIFHPSENYAGLTYLTACFLFTLQLYFSFSGVSDIAIGVSRFYGVELRENFFLPLRSKNMQEFWKNWHHSLTSYLSDYVFKPLYKKLSSLPNKKLSINLSILVTFTVMGLWNGMKPHFIASGFVFGVLNVLYNLKKKSSANSLTQKNNFSLKPFLIFFLISLGLMIFRIESFQQIFKIYTSILTQFIPTTWASGFFAPLAVGGTLSEYFNLTSSLIMCAFVLIFEKKLNEISNSEKINILLILLLWTSIALLGQFNSANNFVYMQTQ